MSPFVLLHGAGGNAASFHPLLDRLGERAVAVDLPGRGAHPGQPLTSIAAMADWLAEHIRAQGWERPVLVGHSMGGGVALELALRSLVPLGGIALVASASRLRVAPALLERARTERVPLDFAFGPGAGPELVTAYDAATRDVPPSTALADWLACNAFDVRDRLVPLQVACLVLWGADDALTIPRFQPALADALGGAGEELPAVGHMLPWESPEALAAALERTWP